MNELPPDAVVPLIITIVTVLFVGLPLMVLFIINDRKKQ